MDPNVWVSAAISSRPGPADRLLELAADADVVLIVSPLLLGELVDVLLRPKFRRYLSVQEAEAFVRALTLLARAAEDVPPTGRTRWCRDPDDEYLVALAAAQDATFLVSGDKDVLAVERPGLLVRSPRAAVDAVEHQHAWGRAFVPGGDDEAHLQAAAEGHTEVLETAGAFLTLLQQPDAAEILHHIVTPESLPHWLGDLQTARFALSGRGMTNQPDRPSSTCAYVKLPPDPGGTIRATGEVLLPPGTLILTLQHRPELPSSPTQRGWRVHAAGEPVPPDELPRP